MKKEAIEIIKTIKKNNGNAEQTETVMDAKSIGNNDFIVLEPSAKFADVIASAMNPRDNINVDKCIADMFGPGFPAMDISDDVAEALTWESILQPLNMDGAQRKDVNRSPISNGHVEATITAEYWKTDAKGRPYRAGIEIVGHNKYDDTDDNDQTFAVACDKQGHAKKRKVSFKGMWKLTEKALTKHATNEARELRDVHRVFCEVTYEMRISAAGRVIVKKV